MNDEELRAERRAERLADYEEWRSGVEFLPLDKFEEVIKRPNVQLPEQGSYYVIANDLEEIRVFLARIENLDAWKQACIIKSDDDLEWDESMDMAEDAGPVNGFTLSYNQYYPVDQRLQVAQQEDLIFINKDEIEFEEDFLTHLTFPCMVLHCYDGGSDRIGNFEVIHCSIYNLPGVSLREGKPTIHLNWI